MPDLAAVWSEALPTIRDNTTGVGVWSALNAGVPVALEEGVFILGLPNPFDIGFDIGVAWGSIELADLDLGLGLNFLQQFEVQATGLAGTITYEDGSSEAFVFGNDILLTNASDYDVDNDGTVEFELALDPVATLENSTDLGFNFLWTSTC